MFEVFKKNWKWFLFPIGIILVYGLFLIFITFPISEYSIEKAGQLGDSFGIINTLFSGSAFIALVITIYLQQQDMRETKKETQKQNFENTFFKMLDLYNSVIKDLYFKSEEEDDFGETKYFNIIGNARIESNGITYKGREVIPRLLNIFKIYKDRIVLDKKTKNGIYEDFHTAFEKNIGHYFGTIYQILKFIDKTNIKNKEDYSNLFRAQFSKDELELLFYHSTSKISRRKFTPLLIHYEFFEHLDIDKIDNRAIEILIIETKKLELNYPLNKIFGKNIKSKEKIDKFLAEK